MKTVTKTKTGTYAGLALAASGIAAAAAFFLTSSGTSQTFVQVSVSGSGSGRVVSAFPTNAINCGQNCSTTSFPDQGQVKMQAIPDPGSVFTGWGEVCDGVIGNTCVFTAVSRNNNTVKAVFDTAPVPSPAPPPISCGTGGLLGEPTSTLNTTIACDRDGTNAYDVSVTCNDGNFFVSTTGCVGLDLTRPNRLYWMEPRQSIENKWCSC